MLVSESSGLNLGQVPGVVKSPLEGHHRRVGIDLTPESHGLLFQGAV